MAIISYTDNIQIMAIAQNTKEYSSIRDSVLANKSSLDGFVEFQNEIWGFHIFDNNVLTSLYGFTMKVVRFEFSKINTLHSEEQEKSMIALFQQLETIMSQSPAYYNLRLPASIMDCVKAYQSIKLPSTFCGGSVALMNMGSTPDLDSLISCHVTEVGQDYLDLHYNELMTLTKQSFETYQGQYHIAPRTYSKACDVYENWISDSLHHLGENRIVAAEHDGKTVGFGLLSQSDHVLEFDLAAVSPESRGLGVYRSITALIRKLSIQDHKYMISCTQLDNYASQNTWISVGMKPYFTFYNIHYDLLP